MSWIDRLNRLPHRIELGGHAVEVLSWNHDEGLIDNVPHRHTYFEVCQVGRHGAGKFIVKERAHAIAPGDLFFARPGIIHQIVNTSRRRMELFWVAFTVTPLRAPGRKAEAGEIDVVLQGLADAEVLVASDEAGRIASLWHALQLWTTGPSQIGQESQLQHLTTALLLAIAQAGAGKLAAGHDIGQREYAQAEAAQRPDEAEHRLARLAIRYVHDNLNRRLPLEEIAAHVHLSPRQLSRLVTKFAGTSPAAYIERARTDRAMALLRDSDSSIKAVAHAVGYSDVHHFTRVFKRNQGVTPGAVRRGEYEWIEGYLPGDLV